VRRKVLVVDDEPDVCWAIESALAGYDVDTTCSGREALTLLSSGDYGLAFVDAKLGDMDGLGLAAIAAELGENTGIVLISGYVAAEDAAVLLALESGLLKAFIPKPFSLEQIRSIAALEV
jgi:CheY-like chemotaxis protein